MKYLMKFISATEDNLIDRVKTSIQSELSTISPDMLRLYLRKCVMDTSLKSKENVFHIVKSNVNISNPLFVSKVDLKPYLEKNYEILYQELSSDRTHVEKLTDISNFECSDQSNASFLTEKMSEIRAKEEKLKSLETFIHNTKMKDPLEHHWVMALCYLDDFDINMIN